jgi:hypothetical protein
MTTNREGPVGIGGWLLVLVVLQTLYTLVKCASLASVIQLSGFFLRSSELTLAIFLVPAVVDAALSLATTITMFGRKRWFRYLFVAEWIAAMLFSLAGLALVYGQIGTGRAAQRILLVVICGLPWILYVFLSRRVKNTYA